MKKIKRSEVKPGQVFSMHGNFAHPCVAICPKYEANVKDNTGRTFAIGDMEGALLHVYCPNGSICWTFADTDVYVDDNLAYSCFGYTS